MSTVSDVLGRVASTAKRLVTGRPSYRRLRDPLQNAADDDEDTVLVVDEGAVSDAEKRRRERYTYFDKWLSNGVDDAGNGAFRYMSAHVAAHRHEYVGLALRCADALVGERLDPLPSTAFLHVSSPGLFLVDAAALLELLVFYDLLTASASFETSRAFEQQFESIMGLIQSEPRRSMTGLLPMTKGAHAPHALRVVVARESTAFSRFAAELAQGSTLCEGAGVSDVMIDVLQVFPLPDVAVNALLKLAGGTPDASADVAYHVFPLWPYMAYEHMSKVSLL